MLGASGQLQLLAGQKHGWTIPLADMIAWTTPVLIVGSGNQRWPRRPSGPTTPTDPRTRSIGRPKESLKDQDVRYQLGLSEFQQAEPYSGETLHEAGAHNPEISTDNAASRKPSECFCRQPGNRWRRIDR
jgi:hypothetical protein